MSEVSETLIPESVPPKKRRLTVRSWVIIGASVLVLLAAGVITAGLMAQNSAAVELAERRDAAVDLFGNALQDCDITDGQFAMVSDRGQTLELDGNSGFLADRSVRQTYCVLTQLDAPNRVNTLMGNTRSLDGRQSDTWEVEGGEVEASWIYHPDDGLDAIFVLELDDDLAESLEQKFEDR